MRQFVVFGIGILALTACGKAELNQEQMTAEATRNKGNFSAVSFSLDADPVCLMSLSSGISDTAHYSGKVYGFCALSCKAKFDASPTAYIK